MRSYCCAVSIGFESPSRRAVNGQFQKAASYEPGQFSDISEDEWFGYNKQRVICKAFELGLMQGRGADFDPSSGVTLDEAITMAARVHNIYNGGEWDFGESYPWYYKYILYAAMEGIIL